MKLARAAAIVLLAAGVPQAAAVEPPRVTVHEGGFGITVPAAILRRADVRRHLTNGLTTAIVASAKPVARSAARGAARVEIRYDPWDEVFFVSHRDFDGRVERTKIAGMPALEKWLGTRAMRFAAISAERRWNIELRILPFTAAEEDDVRAWVSGTSASAAPEASGGGRPASVLFDLLVGTSIRARPVVVYRWTVEAADGQ